MTQEQQKFYEIKTYSDYDVVGRDIDYKIFVNHAPKEIVVLFKASDSDSDWMYNFLVIPFPLRMDKKFVWTTLGYSLAYSSAHNKIIDELCKYTEKYSDYKVAIRGWSFGSAMAKLLARHFEIRTGKCVSELTTYGDVKCWVNPFYTTRKSSLVVRNYICRNDLITLCVPFFWRDNTCVVGDKFCFKKALDTKYYHTHYEEYDYSKYEREDL